MSSVRFELLRLPGVLENHPTTEKYLIETMAGGMAAFDYDGDGRVDLFFTNGAPVPSLVKQHPRDDNHLLHNEGRLHFRDVTAESGLAGDGYSIAASAGDYDNDGRPDLFVAGVNGNRLYHNDGGGRFTDVTERAGLTSHEWSVGAAWLDYDRDGLLDLFVVNYVQWSAGSNPVCTASSGGLRVYCDPRKFTGLANRLFHNRGDGTFEDVSVKSGIARAIGKGMSAAIADYDGDGYPDIFVANDTTPNFLFHNLENGKFQETAFAAGVALNDDGKPVSAMGADFRDYDNDGRPDIVFTALTGETFPLFQNLGKGMFRDATFASRLGPQTMRRGGWGIAIADLNNDGWKDIVSANSHVTDNIDLFSGDRYRLANSVFLNRGDGTFVDVTAQAGGAFQAARAHRGLVVADLDNDGLLDVVVTVLGEAPELWRNVTAGAGHWMEFQLTGRASNRDGIGAEISLQGQTNLQSSSVGYASSALVPVHFGLGDSRIVPRVRVHWPNGKIQLLSNVAGGRRITVPEP